MLIKSYRLFFVTALTAISFNSTLVSAKSLNSDFGRSTVNTNITEAEVEAAQKAWGQALIKISKDFDESGLAKAKKTAEAVIEKAYGYKLGTVLFKPTLAYGEQTYRTTAKGALAYFVGSDKDFAQDTGFALKGWRDYTFKNASVFINGDTALTMGDVILVNKKGETTTVNKTWGFKKDSTGQIRIILHHSSLPYQPQTTQVSQASN